MDPGQQPSPCAATTNPRVWFLPTSATSPDLSATASSPDQRPRPRTCGLVPGAAASSPDLRPRPHLRRVPGPVASFPVPPPHPRTCALFPISGAALRVSPLTAALGATPAPLLPFSTPDPPSTATGFASPCGLGSTSTFPRWLAYPAPPTRVAGRGWVREPSGIPDPPGFSSSKQPLTALSSPTCSSLAPPSTPRVALRCRSVGSMVQYPNK